MTLLKKLKAIRGAICCENTETEIISAVSELYTKILNENKLKEKDIVSIQFTITKDLNAKNPAGALRKAGFAKNTPLFCALEPEYENSLPKCIRVLIHCYSKNKAKHVYLGNAKKLRPDLIT